jgi:signal peptidase I
LYLILKERNMETMGVIFWWIAAAISIGEGAAIIIFRCKRGGYVRQWLDPAFYAIVIAILLRFFVVQAFKIPSSSMEDTFLTGDRIIALKFAYFNPIGPKKGDVVVFKYPEDTKLMFIKRCVGVPGDIVMIMNKTLYINGAVVKEEYVFHKDEKIIDFSESVRDNFGPVKITKDNYFMLGDNRDYSADSRYWGFVPRENICGKAWIIYWPPKRIRVIKHYEISKAK